MFPSPLLVAPMAGGTSTPELVLAAGRAGALGFLAGGYASAEALAAQIAQLRSSSLAFGVNVFVPSAFVPGAPVPDPAAVAAYRHELEAEAEAYEVQLPPLRDGDRRQDDDGWDAKIDLLVSDPVPFVSFTFGLAPAAVVRSLQRAGTRVIASVTSPAEAALAAETGVDAMAVQHQRAGGHTAAFLPPSGHESAPDAAALVARIRDHVDLPLIGAGGLGDAAAVKAVLRSGAEAVQLGTAFVRTAESGARQLHKDALADLRYTETTMTRAFTGKAARALVNRFVREHSATAPEAYPAVHHLTAPIRAAAAARGDAEALNLWAGTAWRLSREAPAGDVVKDFLRGL